MSTSQLAREPIGALGSGEDWVEDTRDGTSMAPILATSKHTGVCSTYHGPLTRMEERGASTGRGPPCSGAATDLCWLGIFQVQCGLPGAHIRVPGSSYSWAYQTETGNQVKPGLGYSRLGALTAVKGIMLITLIETKAPDLIVNLGPFTGLRVLDQKTKRNKQKRNKEKQNLKNIFVLF